MSYPFLVCVNVLTSGLSEKDEKPDPRGVLGLANLIDKYIEFARGSVCCGSYRSVPAYPEHDAFATLHTHNFEPLSRSMVSYLTVPPLLIHNLLAIDTSRKYAPRVSAASSRAEGRHDSRIPRTKQSCFLKVFKRQSKSTSGSSKDYKTV